MNNSNITRRGINYLKQYIKMDRIAIERRINEIMSIVGQ
jgi:DNA-directed RNA polymerase subunit F